MRNIKQNLFPALICNTADVPIAEGILHPFFGILIGPIFTAFAMSASSISMQWWTADRQTEASSTSALR